MKKILTIAMLFFTPVLFADDDGPTIEGGVEMNISAEGNINAAVGNKSCADQQVGTIGKKSTC